MDKGGEPALGAGSPPHPGLMEPIDPHRQRLEPFLDQIAFDVIQVAAEIAPREGGQVAHSIHEERRFGEVVFLGQ